MLAEIIHGLQRTSWEIPPPPAAPFSPLFFALQPLFLTNIAHHTRKLGMLLLFAADDHHMLTRQLEQIWKGKVHRKRKEEKTDKCQFCLYTYLRTVKTDIFLFFSPYMSQDAPLKCRSPWYSCLPRVQRCFCHPCSGEQPLDEAVTDFNTRIGE